MRFKPNKSRYLILLGMLLALWSLVGKRLAESPNIWTQVIVIGLIFGFLLLWLASFEIAIEDELITYRSLFGGKVQFSMEEIKTIKINKYDELTHLIFSRHTLFIDLKSGRRVKINTKVFPARVAELLAQRGWPVRK